MCDTYTQMMLGGQSSSTSSLLRSVHVKGYYTTNASGGMLLANGIELVTKYVHGTLHLKASVRILLTQLSFMLIHWLEEHQERFNMYPAPIEVWIPSSAFIYSFIPVASIVSRIAGMKDNNKSETLVIIPV